MPKSFSLVFILLAALCCSGQPGALDLSFNPGSGANNPVEAIAIQPDGKILIGGEFTSYNGITRNRIVRLNTDGSLDTSFHVGIGASSWVHEIALQADGKILLAGDFVTYNGDTSRGAVRLHPDGSRDTTFNVGSGFNHMVYSIAPQPDGKILVGGTFTAYQNIPASHLVRLNTDGSPDTAFNNTAAPNGTVEKVLLQPDGKILIAGDFTNYNNSWHIRIARANTDGSRDISFKDTSGASAVIFDIALQPDGKIIAGGNFGMFDLQTRGKIARVLADGGLDASFQVDQGANSRINAVEVLTDGRVLAGGQFTGFKNIPANRLVLLSSICEADTTFNPAGSGPDYDIFDIATQPNGKIIIAGEFTFYNGTTRNRIARLYNCLSPQPDSIYGSSYAYCSGTPQTYYVNPVTDATKYEWNLPSGWTGSSDSASITAISTGTGGVITVKAFTDSCGWSYGTARTISTVQPPGVNICLVTVDTASTHNIVIWEKPATTLIDSFFIYRETTTGVYSKIGAVPYDSLSEYHDTAANPNTTSYRYKLSVLDTCGAESALSPYHNTIHLQNLGNGNFQWTFYQIEGQLNPVISFNVYRDNLGNGNFLQIGNVPGSNATFTDVTFNSFTNSEYVVDAQWGISCTPTRAVNTTRSNKKHRNAIATLAVTNPELQNQIEVFPNPAQQEVYIRYPETVHVQRMELLNVLGQVAFNSSPVSGGVPEGRGGNTAKINVESLPKGIYTLSIETNSGKVVKKLVVK